MSVDDPLILARSVASADFKGLTEWFRPGKATADAIQQLETARKPGVTQADDTTNGCSAVQDEDPNDAPTADGASEYSRNKGLEHLDWVEFIENTRSRTEI